MTKLRFGQRSMRERDSCAAPLIRVLNRALAISPMDFTIICGHRGKQAQEEAFATGRSTKHWGDSRHNAYPSEAFDVAPWVSGSIPWTDEGSFYMLAGVILSAANLECVELRYGGDWNRNDLTEDERFLDLGHFERVNE